MTPRTRQAEIHTYDEIGREVVSETEIENGKRTRTEKYYDGNGNVIKLRVKANKPGEAERYKETEYGVSRGRGVKRTVPSTSRELK